MGHLLKACLVREIMADKEESDFYSHSYGPWIQVGVRSKQSGESARRGESKISVNEALRIKDRGGIHAANKGHLRQP